MSKQNVNIPDLNLINMVGLSESKDVRIMEQIIKRYIANLEYISQDDKLGTKYPIREYLEDIVTFVANYNLSRGFILNLTSNAAKEIWKEVRENNSVTSFLFHVTTEYKLVLGEEEFINSCRRLAYACSYNSNNYDQNLSMDNIIKNIDPDLSKSLPNTHVSNLTSFLEQNSWLVTIALINMMNPLII